MTERLNMTAREVGALLGISHQSVYDGAGRGEIPHLRVGKRIIFPRAAIVEWHRTAGGAVLVSATHGA
jgi:excisionase family DNA binding protein